MVHSKCFLFVELDIRKKRGLFSEDTVVLCVEDPTACVGSFGATLNALLAVTEHLSAKQGYKVENRIYVCYIKRTKELKKLLFICFI